MTDAPGWPGIAPRWTSSAKSGVGTALSPVSRVWFTLSHGILDEIYLASYSKSGTCYYMRHLNASGANAGTYLTSAKVATTLCTAKDGETAAGYTAL